MPPSTCFEHRNRSEIWYGSGAEGAAGLLNHLAALATIKAAQFAFAVAPHNLEAAEAYQIFQAVVIANYDARSLTRILWRFAACRRREKKQS